MPTAGGYVGIPIYGIMNKTRINYKRDKIYMQTETLKRQPTGNKNHIRRQPTGNI